MLCLFFRWMLIWGWCGYCGVDFGFLLEFLFRRLFVIGCFFIMLFFVVGGLVFFFWVVVWYMMVLVRVRLCRVRFELIGYCFCGFGEFVMLYIG